MMQKPKAIIFDWDNTLVDTWEIIHAALVETFTTLGHVPWTIDETKSRVAHSLRDSFPKLFGEHWTEARRVYLDSYAAIHLERLAALPGAGAMLEALHDAGYYLAVVSNKTGTSLRLEAEHIGWKRYFSRMIGAGDAKADKPDPAALEMAFEGSGVIRDRDAWYVGDTPTDMESAHRAGMTAVLLGTPHGSPESFAKFPPDLRFPGCEGLLAHLNRM